MAKRRGTENPGEGMVAGYLGSAKGAWDAILKAIGGKYRPMETEWRASKTEFGWICLLRHKQRTLLYLTPERGGVTVAVVLGERAVTIALKSRLPKSVKAMISDARPYAEGRGIRIQVKNARDAAMVAELVDIKTAPK